MKAKITFLLLLLSLSMYGQKHKEHIGQMPKHEVRAVWLTTIGALDWPTAKSAAAQQREMTRILDQLKLVNINTVLIQTRVRASTIYPSALEPFDLCLTGTHGRSPGYDPLQFVVDECHKRGMECHAWMVTLPIGKTHEQRFKEFKRRHPQMAINIGEDGYMNPEVAETGDYLADICAEVTRRYDIDGIHLDYIRYPETWSKFSGGRPGQLSKAKAGGKRKRKTAGKPAVTMTATSAMERRANITAIVRKIHRAVKSLKPWVKLSCSPIGKSGDLARYRSGGWNAYSAVHQDAQGWLREGLMDQLYPMQYFRGNNYYPFALDWQERSYGRTIVSGLGIYFLSPREGNWMLDDITREMSFARHNGIGHCYFRSRFLTDNTRGIYDFVRHFDEAPALIPPMTWAWNQAPTAPTRLQLQRGAMSDRLSWTGATDASRAPYLLYNIYAATTPDVDTGEPCNLIATRLRGEQMLVPHTNGQTLYYAVTALDRYGNESMPVYSDSSRQPVRSVKAQTPQDTRIPPHYYDWSKKQRKKWLKRYKKASF